MNSSEAQRAWFLGPRAENAELMERLIVEALRDHSFWRRNYHPEDGVVIRESDKRSEGYLEATSVLAQEFTTLLAKLKQDLPFFSGRYLGHMLYEQTLAAQVGYFAAMLYNPNNVAAETSPATTAMELEVASDLAKMVGYVPDRSWGHLTSGGTLANFEALWIARNTHYLPLAVAGAARELGVQLEARLRMARARRSAPSISGNCSTSIPRRASTCSRPSAPRYHPPRHAPRSMPTRCRRSGTRTTP